MKRAMRKDREMANDFVVGFRCSDLGVFAVKFQLSRLAVTMSGRAVEGLKRHSKFDPGTEAEP